MARRVLRVPLVAAALVFIFGNGVHAQDSTSAIGVWITAGGRSHIEIYAAGNSLCGRVVWIRDSLKNGSPVLDTKNPEDSLRTRPILGLQMMRGFRWAGENQWKGGSVYDPESGNEYSGKMELEDANTLKLRGYIGIPLFGRTESWTRLRN